jgi:phenylalanyl-tRNA synthetase beta subunit
MDETKTLTDEEVDKAVNKLSALLEKALAAEIRRG